MSSVVFVVLFQGMPGFLGLPGDKVNQPILDNLTFTCYGLLMTMYFCFRARKVPVQWSQVLRDKRLVDSTFLNVQKLTASSLHMNKVLIMVS